MKFAFGMTIPEAWENALVRLRKHGKWIDTEYGERAWDCPMTIIVSDPSREPRVHLKGIVAGHIKGLFEYVDEVLEGTQDFRIGKDWHYTYHERLFNYRGIDQISAVIEKLKKVPYSRRAQAITWIPEKDINAEAPPCVQRLWFRVERDQLVLHVHIRSNDAFKCCFMNMFAMTELQRRVASELQVNIGRYVHIADSFHVYERDWKWFQAFINQIKDKRSKKYWMTTQELINRSLQRRNQFLPSL